MLALLTAAAAGAQQAELGESRDAEPQTEADSAGTRFAPLLPDLTPIPDPAEGASGVSADVGPAVSTIDFVRMVLVLAAVVGAIYLIFFLIRRRTAARVNENDVIRLLGSKTLGGNRNVHLVKVGNSVYLIGAADEAVNLIAEITDTESLDSIQLDDSAALTAGRRSFADVLSELFQGARRPSGAGVNAPRQPNAFLEQQRRRLQQMRPGAADEQP